MTEETRKALMKKVKDIRKEVYAQRRAESKLTLRSTMEKKLVGHPNEYWILKLFKPGDEENPVKVHTSKSYSYLCKIKRRYHG